MASNTLEASLLRAPILTTFWSGTKLDLYGPTPLFMLHCIMASVKP